jgi:DNA-binding transcriptional MerR regulator/methylmalonyl-CoA mutase cobalamin-binding subunit
MYTIGEAAARAGLSVELLRAWERRYGVVRPERTPSGYRQYDPAAIERLRAMRRLVEDGWTPSAAAASLRSIPDSELVATAPSTRRERGAADDAELTDRFVAAAADMDPSALQAVLDEMGARASFETMLDRYLFPSLHALGDAWKADRVSVAAEHAASAAVARWLGSYYDAASSNARRGRPVLIGLPPGARHELGALAHAVAARRAGLEVVYVGADVPSDDWIRAATTTDASVAVIGVPTAADRDSAKAVAGALRRALPGLNVIFGGNGATRTRRNPVLPPDTREAIGDLEELASR